MYLNVTFTATCILVFCIFVTYAARWGVEFLLHVRIVFIFQNLHFPGLDIRQTFSNISQEGTLKSNARNTIQWDFTEQIKYNTNGIKTRSSKNINLLEVKRRHSWIQWSNKVQQHFCWSQVNHCYKCAKRKINKIRHLKILGSVCITIVC